MQFFILNQSPTGRDEAARMDVLKAPGSQRGDAPRCEACGKYVGMRQWLPPYRIELDAWGQNFGDVAFVGNDLLVSLRFKQLWERGTLVGLSGFESVEVVNVRRHRNFRGDPPPYFRAIVSRSRTVIDLPASEFEWGEAPTCPACHLGDIIKRWKRVIIDRTTWTGEDVFIARGLPGSTVVSERFKEWCEANAVGNAVFIPAEEYAHDSYPWEKESGAPQS
jgi:hypothetical protein